jgi:hypothetical protein
VFGPRSRNSIPGGQESILFSTSPRPDLGPTHSYPVGTSGVERPSREDDPSSPSSVEVKIAWSYNSTPGAYSWGGGGGGGGGRGGGGHR